MKTNEMRAYFFGNMYIAPIQHGIQAAHVVTKMFVKYRDDDCTEHTVLHEWGSDHVTKILLNGGYQSNLIDIYHIFDIVCPVLGLPYANFHEEVDALNGALTSVGCVVPVHYFALVESYANDQRAKAPMSEVLFYLKKTKRLTKRQAIEILVTTLKSGKLA